METNHTMGDVVENYSDAKKGAISRMLEAELAFRDPNRRRRLPERANFPVGTVKILAHFPTAP